MLSPIDELKIQARKHCTEAQLKAATAKNERPTLKQIQLKLARFYGFTDWIHARSVLACHSEPPKMGFGKFWYSDKCMVLLNKWCRDLTEAKLSQKEYGGIILPFQKQFVLADAEYMSLIGMDLQDPLWVSIQNNWCEGSTEVRKSLALKRLCVQRIAGR